MKLPLMTLWTGTALACCLLEAAEPVEPRPAPEPAPSAAGLLRTLVTQSLRVADEDDPVRRADSCNEIADYLTRSISEAAARGDNDEAERLARYLGEVLDRGVVPNVARIDPGKLEGERQAQWVLVTQRLDRMGDAFEKNLVHGRAHPPPSLRRVLEHSWHGLTRIREHARGERRGEGRAEGHGHDGNRKAWEAKGKNFFQGLSKFFDKKGRMSGKKGGGKKEGRPEGRDKNTRPGKKSFTWPGRPPWPRSSREGWGKDGRERPAPRRESAPANKEEPPR